MPQQPMDGDSLMYSFNNPDAPNVKERQYYEMFGNRAIWVDGWKYNGKLDRVIFTVSDENTVPPRDLPAVYY